MEVHMSEIAATNPSLEKDFSAPSARSLRRAIGILGWVAVSTLVITGLVAIFDRAGVFQPQEWNSPTLMLRFILLTGATFNFLYRAGRT